MDMDPLMFASQRRGEDVTKWIREITRIFPALQIPNEWKVDYNTYLSQGGCTMLVGVNQKVSIRGGDTVIWKDFEKVFLELTFSSTYNSARDKSSFLDLPQGSLTVDMYNSKFYILDNFCSYMCPMENSWAMKYVRGLSDNLQNWVMASGPNTLADLTWVWVDAPK